MPDDNDVRGEEADEEERHQRQREREESRARVEDDELVGDELDHRLGELDDALESHDYPTTTDELIVTYGDYEIETDEGWASLEELFGTIGNETYRSAENVRSRIQELIHVDRA